MRDGEVTPVDELPKPIVDIAFIDAIASFEVNEHARENPEFSVTKETFDVGDFVGDEVLIVSIAAIVGRACVTYHLEII